MIWGIDGADVFSRALPSGEKLTRKTPSCLRLDTRLFKFNDAIVGLLFLKNHFNRQVSWLNCARIWRKSGFLDEGFESLSLESEADNATYSDILDQNRLT